MPKSKITAKISVHVYPNAAKNEVVGFTDDVLRVKISAPHVKGKANKELLDFLCQQLALDKDRIVIIKGHTTRNKIVAIDGMSKEAAIKLLLPDSGS